MNKILFNIHNIIIIYEILFKKILKITNKKNILYL